LPRARKRAAGIVTTERGWAFATSKRAEFALEAARVAAFWLGGETDETYPFLQPSFII